MYMSLLTRFFFSFFLHKMLCRVFVGYLSFCIQLLNAVLGVYFKNLKWETPIIHAKEVTEFDSYSKLHIPAIGFFYCFQPAHARVCSVSFWLWSSEMIRCLNELREIFLQCEELVLNHLGEKYSILILSYSTYLKLLSHVKL